MAGRLYPEKQQLLFTEFCSPCTTPACIQKEALPESQAGQPAGIGATTPGSSLTARVGKGQMMPSVYTRASPLRRGVTHTWRTRLVHQRLVSKGRHCPRISPGQQEGASPAAKPCFSTWTQPALVENSHLYTAAFQSTHILGKNPKIFPHSLFQNNNTPGFYNPPRQHPICSPSPRGKLLRAKSLHGCCRFLSQRVSFHKHLLIRAELLAQPLQTKPKLTANF